MTTAGRRVRRPGRRRPRRRSRPGSPASVRAREVITPLDLERDYGLTGGHPLHGEQALDQFFLWRPFLGSGRYRLADRRAVPVRRRAPIPGGGITGQPGQNAAREILVGPEARAADVSGGSSGVAPGSVSRRAATPAAPAACRMTPGDTRRDGAPRRAGWLRRSGESSGFQPSRSRGRPAVPRQEAGRPDPDHLRVGREELLDREADRSHLIPVLREMAGREDVGCGFVEQLGLTLDHADIEVVVGLAEGQHDQRVGAEVARPSSPPACSRSGPSRRPS